MLEELYRLRNSDAIDLWKKGKLEWNRRMQEDVVEVIFDNVNIEEFVESIQSEKLDFQGYMTPEYGMKFKNIAFGFYTLDFSMSEIDFKLKIENCRFQRGCIDISFSKVKDGMIEIEKNTFYMGGGLKCRETKLEESYIKLNENTFIDGFLDFSYLIGIKSSVLIYDNEFERSELDLRQILFDGKNFKMYENEINLTDVIFGYINIIGNFGFFKNIIAEGRVDFRGAKFDKGIKNFLCNKFENVNKSFCDIEFGSGKVDFFGNDFGKGCISFNNSKVDGIFDLRKTRYDGGRVLLEECEFNGPVNCSELENSESIIEISFKKSSFEKSLDISSNSFKCVIDLRSTALKHQLTLDNLECDFYKNSKGKALDENDAPRLKRLKEIAEKNRDHFLAMDCHAKEMRVRREFNKNIPYKLGDILFDKISDYGRSIWRPSFLLLINWFLFAFIYFDKASHFVVGGTKCEKIKEALSLSGGYLVPFISSSRSTRKEGVDILFGGDLTPLMNLLTASQSLISFVLIFLIGLGLRNRFKF